MLIPDMEVDIVAIPPTGGTEFCVIGLSNLRATMRMRVGLEGARSGSGCPPVTIHINIEKKKEGEREQGIRMAGFSVYMGSLIIESYHSSWECGSRFRDV
jgi:hypothetical protein